jgi:tetratricopeptide (TPR) repeat protein
VRRGGALALAMLLVAGAAVAEPEAVARARAERLAAAGQCEEALAEIAAREAVAPLDARTLVVAGQCQARLGRHAEAAASLARARELDARLPQIDLQLAMAQFHADDLDGAARSLANARAAGETGPEVEFYEAMLALASGGDARAAAERLERAGRDRPATLDPAASYYAGLAWQSAAEAARARAALARVIEEHPGTPWADAARRALDGLAPAVGATFAPWASLRAGVEYDTNVAFLGRGLATPDEIGSQGDARGVWSVDAGTPLLRIGSTTIGARAFYVGSAHFDLRDYDLAYPGAAFWIDHPTGARSLLRVEAGAGFAWLGYEAYAASAWLAPQWFLEHGAWGTTRFHATALGYDFRRSDGDEVDGVGVGLPCPGGASRCGPAGLDEREFRDRDGIGVIAGVEHSLPLRGGDTVLRGGPLLERYEARGDEWDAWGVGGEVGVRQRLPLALTLDLAARYVHRLYDDPSSYPDPRRVVRGRQYELSDDDRRDDYFEVDVRLERPLTRWLTATVRYDYLRNASDVAVFDYDRHLVGGYLTLLWQGARP